MRRLLPLSFLALSLSAQIHEIKSMAEVASFADADTVIFFDLDKTVFDGVGPHCTADWIYQQTAGAQKTGMPIKEAAILLRPYWEAQQSHCQVKAIEAITAAEIRKLQNKGLTVMALTARSTLSLESTLKQLKSVNVDFSKTAWPKVEIVEPTFEKSNFQHGVFLSGDRPKGELFGSYFKLNLVKQMPKTIILVDDLKTNLESMQAVAQAQNIKFIGLYYPLIDKRSKRPAKRAPSKAPGVAQSA
ncbi:MAG: DUF2608 domain-containing protein [Myxococcota bacterium]